jgi:hypothetical protein
MKQRKQRKQTKQNETNETNKTNEQHAMYKEQTTNQKEHRKRSKKGHRK